MLKRVEHLDVGKGGIPMRKGRARIVGKGEHRDVGDVEVENRDVGATPMREGARMLKWRIAMLGQPQ
jgi:hypothetical protein